MSKSTKNYHQDKHGLSLPSMMAPGSALSIISATGGWGWCLGKVVEEGGSILGGSVVAGWMLLFASFICLYFFPLLEVGDILPKRNIRCAN